MKITIYKEKPTNGETFELPYTVITDSFLDEELDACTVEIKHTAVGEPFPRFCVAGLFPTENADPKYFFVASDRVVTNVATGLSDHVVQLIEPTKWLERFMVGNKTVTQPIYTDYISEPMSVSKPMYIEYTEEELNAFKNNQLQGEIPQKELVLKEEVGLGKTPSKAERDQIPLYGISAFDVGKTYGTVPFDFSYCITLNGEEVLSGRDVYRDQNAAEKTDKVRDWFWFEDICKAKGVSYENYINTGALVTVSYIIIQLGGSIMLYHGEFSYYFLFEQAQLPAVKSLFDAAMSMIYASEIKLMNGQAKPTPRFVLNKDIAKKLKEIKSPEITVTNATLREALDEIGKVIDSITRLDIVPNGNCFEYEITFEKYCKDTSANLSELGDPCEIVKKVSCEDYCTALDATVDNLVNYREGGSVWDPCYDLWRTVRSEDASYRVTEDTAEIFTAFPIERIDALLCRIYNEEWKSGYKDKDLTKYLFEAADYSTLSSYTTAYPHSKAFALRYALGQRGITELNFTVPNAVGTIFEKPALVNIINEEFETSYNSLKALDFTKVLFRVEYVPTGSARVIMRKPDSFGKPESFLPYNQGAAKLDATAFGRSMFGAVLRMGNKETSYTYITSPDAAVPMKGERFGEDGYIAEIREEYAPQQKKVMLTVVDGFNRLSQFVGVDKTQRMFEISERMSLDRHIVYEDKCLISTEARMDLTGSIVTHSSDTPEGEESSDPYMNGSFLEHLREAFASGSGGPGSFFVKTKGFGQDGHALAECFHPCIPYAMGNAISFTASFYDNYSAGRRVDNSGKRFYSTETDVCYTDMFGRVEKLSFEIDDGFWRGHQGKFSREQYEVAANMLPALGGESFVSGYMSPIVRTPIGNELYIDKDSRETIKTLTYQLSFLGDDGIKISPFFAESLPPTADRAFKFNIVPTNTIMSNTTEQARLPDAPILDTVAEVIVGGGGQKMVKLTFKAECDANGWAAVEYNEKSGLNRFLFGKNTPVRSGDTITVYFNFYHEAMAASSDDYEDDFIESSVAHGGGSN